MICTCDSYDTCDSVIILNIHSITTKYSSSDLYVNNSISIKYYNHYSSFFPNQRIFFKQLLALDCAATWTPKPTLHVILLLVIDTGDVCCMLIPVFLLACTALLLIEIVSTDCANIPKSVVSLKQKGD